MELFARLQSLVSSRTWKGAAEWIPAGRVTPAPDRPPPPIVADETYLRLWLNEARLSHSRKWFSEWHPVVHAAVARTFGNNRVEEQVALVPPAKIPGFEGAAAAAVTLRKELTPLLPFPGGSVSFNVGLVAVKGDNTIRTLIDVVGKFGGLITTVALSTGTAIATQVVDGFEALLGLSGNVGTLAFEGTLTTAGGGAERVLAPGYLAVLEQAQAPGTLWVREGELVAWAGPGQPSARPAGSYLLLRLESRAERDDWRYLDDIARPLKAARAAQDAESRRAHYQQAIIAARTSPDLHEADRIRVAAKLQEMRDTDQGHGAVGLPDTLEAMAESITMTPREALESRPSLAALLA